MQWGLAREEQCNGSGMVLRQAVCSGGNGDLQTDFHKRLISLYLLAVEM